MSIESIFSFVSHFSSNFYFILQDIVRFGAYTASGVTSTSAKKNGVAAAEAGGAAKKGPRKGGSKKARRNITGKIVDKEVKFLTEFQEIVNFFLFKLKVFVYLSKIKITGIHRNLLLRVLS